MAGKDSAKPTPTPPDERKSIDKAERAVERAFATGKVDRATITRRAQLDAAEAVTMAGKAMEADEAADEATKLLSITESMGGDRAKAKEARDREREARRKAKAEHRAATKSAKRAYEAIKFSDPTKLGLMRFVQVTLFVHVSVGLLALILTSRDTVVYSSLNFIDWIMVVLETVLIYLFANRLKICRPFAIATGLFAIVARTVVTVMNGDFSLFETIISELFYIFLVIYFIFSDRVKAVFVNDLSFEQGVKEEQDFVIERHGWPFIRNLLIYFVVFSILGHWMEAAMCQLIRLGIVQGDYDPSNTMLWRDWFYPYAMEGAAVCFIALFLYPLLLKLKEKFASPIVPYVISFFANALTCTAIEFFSGLVFNAQLQNWDYSELPFNFMGQICLQNAMAFGAAASIIAWWVYPAMERGIARVRPAIMNIVCVITTIIGAILFSLYAIAPPQGIDLGAAEREAEVQDAINSERHSILSNVDFALGFTTFLEQQIESSQNLDDAERAQYAELAAEATDLLAQLKDKVENAAIEKTVEHVILTSDLDEEAANESSDAENESTDAGETPAEGDAALDEAA